MLSHEFLYKINEFVIVLGLSELLYRSDPIIEAHFNLAIAYERDNSLGKALQEITVSPRWAPLDPDEDTKAIICAELGDLACARDEWAHLVQVAPDYPPARVNLGILDSSHLSLAASTSGALNGIGFVFAR